MRKITISAIAFALVSLGVDGQTINNVGKAAAEKCVQDASHTMKIKNPPVNIHQAETPIWTETFASGIPSTWLNQGYLDNFSTPDTAAKWVYRGPSTTPSNASGSIGAYSGVATNANLPILSPTASNGFVIFDSDYLDNNGVAGAFGTGASPSPHVGTLTTPVINLSANQKVVLSFYQYYRRFQGPSNSTTQSATFVSFSTDGGLTWGNRTEINREVWINSATPRDNKVELNVSSLIGGSTNARIRFEFWGDYYFWMIDDIELNVAPRNDLRFTYNFGLGAPAIDIINADTNLVGKYGYVAKNNAVNETRTYAFDANAVNFGSGTQTNVKLTVEIRDASFNLVNSYTSSVKNSSASLDTIDFNILNTVSTPWTASSNALYNIIYKVSSDSTSVSDTIIYNQNDTLMALDRGDWVNTFGQNNAKAIAIVYEFNSDVEVKSVMVPIQTTGGAATQVGGVIQIAVCAGTGFTNGTNPPTALIGVSANYAITQADITRGYLVVPVNEGPGTDRVVLPAGFYYIIATFNPANVTGAPRVTLINDAKIDQANGMNLFFSLPTSATPNTWFSGFTGSNQVNAIGIRPVVTKSQLSTKEETLLSSVSVSPNPASSFLNVNFNDVTGNFTLTMTDLTGKVVSMEKVNVLGSMQHTLSLNGLSAGVYMLNINDGKASATQKIVVQ